MTRKHKILIPLVTLLAIAPGCSWFSGKSADVEIVFPVTDVGTPQGEKLTRDIGPAGGTLASADGRFTLTIPQNALTETIAFSIQPITDKADGGLGLAYRLEPSGKTFKPPLQIAVKYDEKDLEGTIPEALSLAYQDQTGAWRAQNAAVLDNAAKTVTFSTTHFSDWLLLRTIGISPVKATVLVGEAVHIKVDSCPDRDWIHRYNIWKYVFGSKCSKVSTDNSTWSLAGAGVLTSTDNSTGIVYTAPPVKPADPLARVIVDIDILIRDPDSGEVRTYSRKFECRIKIIDRGYKAIGTTADAQFSGVVCDLESPFTVNADVKIIQFALKFTPSSATNGTWTMSGSMPMITGSGEGTYTIEQNSADHPMRIAVNGRSTGKTPVGSRTRAGALYIGLVYNEGSECEQQGGQ